VENERTASNASGGWQAGKRWLCCLFCPETFWFVSATVDFVPGVHLLQSLVIVGHCLWHWQVGTGRQADGLDWDLVRAVRLVPT
jgi:hypothetical protein